MTTIKTEPANQTTFNSPNQKKSFPDCLAYSNRNNHLAAARANAVGKRPECSLPPDTGECRAEFIRYYFDATTAECKTFNYGGCGGNPNRFTSVRACYDICSPHEATVDNVHILSAKRYVIVPRPAVNPGPPPPPTLPPTNTNEKPTTIEVAPYTNVPTTQEPNNVKEPSIDQFPKIPKNAKMKIKIIKYTNRGGAMNAMMGGNPSRSMRGMSGDSDTIQQDSALMRQIMALIQSNREGHHQRSHRRKRVSKTHSDVHMEMNPSEDGLQSRRKVPRKTHYGARGTRPINEY